jgi:hypothetical protein
MKYLVLSTFPLTILCISHVGVCLVWLLGDHAHYILMHKSASVSASLFIMIFKDLRRRDTGRGIENTCDVIS